jgi:signal transduction histidine kinase
MTQNHRRILAESTVTSTLPEFPPSLDPSRPATRSLVTRLAVPVALLLVLLTWAGCIALLTSGPWLGLSLEPSKRGEDGLRIVQVRGPAQEAGVPRDARLVALGTQSLDGALKVGALDLTEEPDVFTTYTERREFYRRQDQLVALASQDRVWLRVMTPDSGEIAVGVRPQAVRPINSLPLSFWFQMLVGAVALLVSAWVVASQPASTITRVLGVSGLAILGLVASSAVYGSRELALPADLFHALSVANHVSATVFGISVTALLMFYPVPLIKVIWFLLIVPVFAVWTLLESQWWLPSPAYGLHLQALVFLISVILLGLWQWRRSRGRPLERAALRAATLSLWSGAGLFALLYVLAPNMGALNHGNAHGLFLITYVGLVLGFGRYRLVDLDAWSLRVLMWVLGVGAVLVMDVLITTMLLDDQSLGLILSLVICGAVYFPLRQLLWRVIFRRREPNQMVIAGEILSLGIVPAHERAAHWRRLLGEMFNTRRINQLAEAPPGGKAVQRVQVLDDGLLMRLPALVSLPAVELRGRDHGRRLFSTQDRRLAERLSRLVDQMMRTRDAYDRGAREERERIADDLHDDLGAKLLTLVHLSDSVGSHRVAAVARDALQEMRLSVREMKAHPAPLEDLLADWRAETVDRLEGANIRADWRAHAVVPVRLVGSRTISQLTRVLREAVSNVIRHSGGTRCAIRIEATLTHLTLEVEDDGRGLEDAQVRLSSIERRVFRLGGTYQHLRGAEGGLRLRVRAPIDGAAAQ